MLGLAGAWWYGDRFPAVATKAAATAAGTVARAAEQVGARLSAKDSARVAAEALRRWVPLAAASSGGGSPLARLGRRGGPAYVSVGADSLATLLGGVLGALLPADVEAPALAVQGDRLFLRGVVARRALMGDGALEALLGTVVDGRDTLLLAGELALARAGLARYRIRDIRVGGVSIPDPLHPALLAQLRPAPDADAGADSADGGASGPGDALAFPLPATVADLRIADGRVVFYRAVPR